MAAFTASYFLGRSLREGKAEFERREDKRDASFDKAAAEQQNSLQEIRKQFEAASERQENRLNAKLDDFEDQLAAEMHRLVQQENLDLEGERDEVSKKTKLVQEAHAAFKTAFGLVEEGEGDKSLLQSHDPYINYMFVRALRGTTDTSKEGEAKRREVGFRLEAIIALGLRQKVDANLLFNSGMAASSIELEDQALRLFTLSDWVSPTTSHTLAKRRLEMTIGRRYIVQEDKGTATLVSDVAPPKQVINEAFTAALSAASNAPLPQNEIIYAELWNMSQKMREVRGYERMLETLHASYRARNGEKITSKDFTSFEDQEAFDADVWTQQKGETIPSNLPGKIAAVHALIGTKGWDKKYAHFLGEAVELAAGESDMTTWRQSFIRDAKSTADRLGRRAELNALFEMHGLEIGEDGDGPDLNPDMLAALQAALQQRMAGEAD